jgi:hypothetical protein
MKELIHEYFWHLFFLLAIAWYFGFVSGKWWEQEKTKDQQGNDEIWW